MKISPVSINLNNRHSLKFKGNEAKDLKPLINLDENVADDEVVTYGTWGPNYVYPITAGQIRSMREKEEALKGEQKETKNVTLQKEAPDEYYRRKLYSTEWTM